MSEPDRQQLVHLLVDFRKQRPDQEARPDDPEIVALAQWFDQQLEQAKTEVLAEQVTALTRKFEDVEGRQLQAIARQLEALVKLFRKSGGEFTETFEDFLEPLRELEEKFAPGGAYTKPLDRTQKGP